MQWKDYLIGQKFCSLFLLLLLFKGRSLSSLAFSGYFVVLPCQTKEGELFPYCIFNCINWNVIAPMISLVMISKMISLLYEKNSSNTFTSLMLFCHFSCYLLVIVWTFGPEPFVAMSLLRGY